MDPIFQTLLAGAKKLTSFNYVGLLAVLTAAVLSFGPLKEADDQELLVYVVVGIALLFLMLVFHRATEADSNLLKIPIVIVVYAVTLALVAFIVMGTGNALIDYPRCLPVLEEGCSGPFEVVVVPPPPNVVSPERPVIAPSSDGPVDHPVTRIVRAEIAIGDRYTELSPASSEVEKFNRNCTSREDSDSLYKFQSLKCGAHRCTWTDIHEIHGAEVRVGSDTDEKFSFDTRDAYILVAKQPSLTDEPLPLVTFSCAIGDCISKTTDEFDESKVNGFEIFLTRSCSELLVKSMVPEFRE